MDSPGRAPTAVIEMYWQSLSLMDALVIGAIVTALLSAIPLYRLDVRVRRRRYEAWHRAYFKEGRLLRALMSRWGGGTARLTDQRSVSDIENEQRT